MRELTAPPPVHRGIQTRVGVLVLAAALAPMTLLGWASVASLEGMRDALLREREALARSTAQQVEHGLREMLEALAAVPAGPDASAWIRGAQHDALRAAQLRSRLLSGAFLLDDRGAVLAEGRSPAPDLRESLSGCAAVRETIRAGVPRIVSPSGDLAARWRYAVVPLRAGTGETGLAAVGAIDVRSSDWSALLPSVTAGRGARSQLLDERGAVVAGTPIESAGRTDVVVSSSLTVLPWTVALTQPRSEMFATVADLQRRWLTIAPALAGLAVVFAWGVARSVKRPIAQLEAGAARIAAGDLLHPLPPLGEDEIGRLGRSFEAMRLALARDETRRRLLRKVISAQEEERKRIARELHDETCQTITALKMKLDLAAAGNGDAREERIADARGMATRSLDELHRIIFDLRPSILDDLGLLPAIRWMAQRNLSPHAIRLRCEFEELPLKLPFELEIAVFRAVQEAINNVVRHAGAESVLVQIAASRDTLEIDVEDDGSGFDPAEVGGPSATGRGLGILGMKERMELIGGTAEVSSSPGGGTHVSLRVPLPTEA